MGGTLIKQTGNSQSNSLGTKRAYAALSDGTTLHVVVDRNAAGAVGGDGTGIPKANFYQRSTGGVFTLKNTISLTVAANSAYIGCSMAADAGNNLHFCFVDPTDHTVKYIYASYSAGTWTPVAAVAALPDPGNATGVVYYGVDIDCIGTDVGTSAKVVIAAIVVSTGTTKYTNVTSYVRNASSVWTLQVASTVYSGNYCWFTDISVAASQEAVVSNIGYFCVSVVGVLQGVNTSTGTSVLMFKTNVSTGAWQNVNTTVYPAFDQSVYSYSHINTLFYAGSMQWVFCHGRGYGFDIGVSVFSWNGTTNAKTDIIPYSQASGSPSYIATSFFSGNTANNILAFCYSRDTQRILAVAPAYVPGFFDMQISLVARLDLVHGVVTFSPVLPLDGAQGYPAAPSAVYGNAQSRNMTKLTTMANFFLASAANVGLYVYNYKPADPLAAVAVTPAAGATVTTDRPNMVMNHKFTYDYPAYQVKGVFQMASDAGFTTNLRTLTEADSSMITANGTGPSGKTIQSAELITAALEMYQGTWYYRTASIDDLLSQGPWSGTNQLTITHPPAPANLYPTGGVVFVWGLAGQINFTWTFTDPSPYDYQTAYQIIVKNNTTGTTVVDSGKITSAVPSGVVTIPSGSKDTQLNWIVRLWDSDNVQGSDSGQQLFLVTDAPAPSITGPVSPLTSSIPTFTWTTGITGAKTQSAWVLTVTQGSTVVYSSGWTTGAATSLQLPLGYLVNNQSYTVTLTVRDNYNLEGTTSALYTTSWTIPAAPTTGYVYLQQFASRGFVWITVDPTGFDANFIYFNLYRRQYGTAAWTLVKTWTDSSNLMSYRDFLVSSGVQYDYAVTQVTQSVSGDVAESLKKILRTVTPVANGYWLLNTVNPDLSVPLFIVTGESFSEDYEQETYLVIGRGQHVDYGSRIGFTGTLNAQLRDTSIGGVAHTNYALDPSMANPSSVAGSVPSSWSYNSSGSVGTLTAAFVATPEPAPTGKAVVYRVRSSALGTANTNWFQVIQTIPLVGLPPAAVGQTVTFSIWVYGTISGLNLYLSARNAADAVLGTGAQVTNPTPFDTYVTSPIPVSSPDYQSGNPAGNWKRVSCNITWPAGAVDHLTLAALQAGDGAGGQRDLIVCGAQVEIGTATSYIDGDQYGGQWLGVAPDSASNTNGYYTARQQAQDVVALKALRTPVYLRNPFGDLLYVATGDIATQRVAGVGASEYSDITVPYSEVAF